MHVILNIYFNLIELIITLSIMRSPNYLYANVVMQIFNIHNPLLRKLSR